MIKRPEQLLLPFPGIEYQVLLSIEKHYQFNEGFITRMNIDRDNIQASFDREVETYQEPEPFCGPPQVVYTAADICEVGGYPTPQGWVDYEVKFE